MQTISVTLHLPVPPDNWHYTGEYRKPNKGESYFTVRTENPRRMVSTGKCSHKQFIIEKGGNTYV